MSTPEPAPPAPPALPTPQDVQVLFDRATEAAQRAETAAGRLEAAQGAARQETTSRWPEMPREMVDQITKATAEQVVSALNAQYELRGQSPPPGAPSEAGAVSPPASGQDAAGVSPPEGETPPPEFRNLAHRILGY